MGSLFRSEEVLLGQMFLQPEAAYTSVSRLGEEGIVEFRDLNENINSFQLKYVGDVRRAEEMERKLNFIKSEIQKEEIEMPEETSSISEIPTMREITELEVLTYAFPKIIIWSLY
ncbi:hypothetical protein AAG570_010402 [Ranatra chinensis]|uniref:V-type proton ATPase subunit a n=1 Tax=Ranatra chinensis TaxID=642074 RepID=A0ABD0YYH7_9HEMI